MKEDSDIYLSSGGFDMRRMWFLVVISLLFVGLSACDSDKLTNAELAHQTPPDSIQIYKLGSCVQYGQLDHLFCRKFNEWPLRIQFEEGGVSLTTESNPPEFYEKAGENTYKLVKTDSTTTIEFSEDGFSFEDCENDGDGCAVYWIVKKYLQQENQ